MDSKRLSVIIPGYKTPSQWWDRCVSSVLKALDDNDEIICVDDGTPNGTPLLYEFEKRDRRIKVIYKENGGLSSARNTGLEYAKGNFVTFVDSDDEVYPDVFRKCVKKIEDTDADIALYGVKTIWVDEQLYKEDIPSLEIFGKLLPKDVKILLDKCLLNYAWNKIYRRSFLNEKKLRFSPKGMPCEDIVFNLECIMAGAEWVMVNQIGYIYYRTGGTLLSRYRKFNSDGLRLGIRTWAKYARTSDDAYKLFALRGVLEESVIAWEEWNNLWRLNSPYTISEKLKWIRKHREILLKLDKGGKTKILAFSVLFFVVCQLIYSFFRRYFYFDFIRRWHIKCLYPSVKELARYDK